MPDQPPTPDTPAPETTNDAAPTVPAQDTQPPADQTAPPPKADVTPEPVASPPPAPVEVEAAPATPVDVGTPPTPAVQPIDELLAKGGGYFWGTGRRKAAVARVRIRLGTGKFLIQKREIDDYFFDVRHRMDIVAPLKTTTTLGKYDIFINVHGGGQTGQAGAIVLGVARALLKADPALEPSLRDGNYLTRDARKVERKKYGQRGARRRFQFSKR